MAVLKRIPIGDLGLKRLDNGLVDFDLAINANYVRQKIRHKLLTWKGEYFADSRIGMPYKQRVLVNNPNLLAIRNIFYQAISDTYGVERITSLTLQFDPVTSNLGVKFSAILNNGEILNVDPSEFDRDFIISLLP